MKIMLNYDDHEPPHVHIAGSDRCQMYVTGEYKKGKLPHGKESDLREWLALNQEEIMEAKEIEGVPK